MAMISRKESNCFNVVGGVKDQTALMCKCNSTYYDSKVLFYKLTILISITFHIRNSIVRCMKVVQEFLKGNEGGK